ncbi:MAG: AAA family ATPase [Gammaproteobacteria bacterium]|nr:AAA family ATPase [Gammaproteobacteria bacterium]MBU1624685.1 AAA family ATPase [Gammaproteobacteria bacterium]MBU1982529.1 AAA family ATPase [Gammaproteobacteria bacterium]
MRLILENVRGFGARTEVPIKPLTVLIGENSTGKSTVLSMLNAALQPNFPFGENPFNSAPFDMGTFDTIATYKGGKFGRASTFTLGIMSTVGGEESGIETTYTNDYGTPAILASEWTSQNATLKLERKEASGNYTLHISTKAKDGKRKEFDFEVDLRNIRRDRNKDLRTALLTEIFSQGKSKTSTPEDFEALFDTLFEASSIIMRQSASVVALAPLRTKPRRTYDETKDDFKPEGDHIPLLLSRLSSGGKLDNEKVAASLNSFGITSHLFDSIKIKRLGKRPSDPFQVRIKASGPDVNLTDVGYGVSQALPIIVDSIMAKKGQTLLIQQPEVHLHPRAQASLGTFFSTLVAVEHKKFVIETHSDYLVDRIRQEIAKKTIKHSDVSLLYFERKGTDLHLSPITLDSTGNILNPPDGYRDFFLEEEMNHLLRGAD